MDLGIRQVAVLGAVLAMAVTIVACADDPAVPCADRFQCKAYGLCWQSDEVCVARTNQDCRATVGCWFAGQCWVSGAKCIALSDEDCEFSEFGEKFHLIRAVGGKCVLPVGGCPASRAMYQGRCLRRFEDQARCLQKECTHKEGGSHCDATPCLSDGKCTFVDGACVAATDDDCIKKSDRCSAYGRCSAVQGECVAASDAGCAASTGCEKLAFCSLVGDRCLRKSVNDCDATKRCEGDPCGPIYRETYSGIACFGANLCTVVHDGQCYHK